MKRHHPLPGLLVLLAACHAAAPTDEVLDETPSFERGLDVECFGSAACSGEGAIYSATYRIGASSTARGELLQTFRAVADGAPERVWLALRNLRQLPPSSPAQVHVRIVGPVQENLLELASLPTLREGAVDLEGLPPGQVPITLTGAGVLLEGSTYGLLVSTDDASVAGAPVVLVGVGALVSSTWAEGGAYRRGRRWSAAMNDFGDTRFRSAGAWQLAFTLTGEGSYDRCVIAHGGCDPLVTCTPVPGDRICGDCPPGYSGDGETGCVEIDECETDNGGCDPLTDCTNTPGGRICGECPGGYTGDGDAGCEDLDECATGNGGCDALTLCTNTPGGRACGACPGGYTGDGEAGCVDIDECQAGNGGCDDLTECVNTAGTRLCGACPDGYAGDGETGCADIDECLAANGGCDALTSCTNFDGGRTCGECPSGYTGDGETGCDDIDECATDNGGCDDLTECTNTAGWRSCGACPSGYTGDGEAGCVDIDECETANGGCDLLTSCTNTPGWRTCGACPSGYTGDGEAGCVDIDECGGTAFSSIRTPALTFDGYVAGGFPSQARQAASYAARAAIELVPVSANASEAVFTLQRFEIGVDANRNGVFYEDADAWMEGCPDLRQQAAAATLCGAPDTTTLTTSSAGTFVVSGKVVRHFGASSASAATGTLATGTFVGTHAAPSAFSITSAALGTFGHARQGFPILLNNLANECGERGLCTNTPGSYTCACEIDSTFDGTTCVADCPASTIVQGASCVPCAAGSAPSPDRTSCVTCDAGTYAEAGDTACHACPAGSIAPAGASSCTRCQGGFWSEDGVTCIKDLSRTELAWSETGPVAGKDCYPFQNPSETTWANRYLCFPQGGGWNATLVDQAPLSAQAGFDPLDLVLEPTCLNVYEPSDPNWLDLTSAGRSRSRMHLCLSRPSPLYWWNINTGQPSCDVTSGTCPACIQIRNASEPAPHTWLDNWLCADRRRARELRVARNVSGSPPYCDASLPTIPQCAATCAAGTTRVVGPAQTSEGPVCVPCLAGTVPGKSGADAFKRCLPCPYGFFAAADGSDACEACPAGTYADQLGATSCRPCPAGTTSQPGAGGCEPAPTCSGSCSCAAGFTYVDGRCVDVNECEASPCTGGRECINTAGSYFCGCAAGWRGTECRPVAAGAFRTHTQSEWGSTSGAAFTSLAASFSSLYPSAGGYLQVGDTWNTTSAGPRITLQTQAAVTTLLPTAGTPAALVSTQTNPASLANSLAGNTVALKLNVDFDHATASFSASDVPLSSLVVCDAASACAGLTVADVLQRAHQLLGNKGSALTHAQADACAAAINATFQGGSVSTGFLCYP